MGSEFTKQEIESAIARILQGIPTRIGRARRLSIAAVAEEAGVSNATIHKRYPAVAAQIRGILKDGREAIMTEQNTEISVLHRQLAEMRKALKKREGENRRLKLVNILLAREIRALREELEECAPLPDGRSRVSEASTSLEDKATIGGSCRT
ncbi:hypothetical protein [Cupriavidus sp. PET2-C1]